MASEIAQESQEIGTDCLITAFEPEPHDSKPYTIDWSAFRRHAAAPQKLEERLYVTTELLIEGTNENEELKEKLEKQLEETKHERKHTLQLQVLVANGISRHNFISRGRVS